jgi:hypothetical protein
MRFGRIVAVAAALLVGAAAFPASAQRDGMEKLDYMPTDTFGYLPTFQLDPIFNYLSTYGPTSRHNRETLTNSASHDLEGGFLSCETGTTAESECQVDTVETGRYEAGREARWGMGRYPVTLPTDDGAIEVGAFTDDDGSFYRIEDTDDDGRLEFCVVYRDAGDDAEICGLERQADGSVARTDTPFFGEQRPSDFNPFNQAWVAIGWTNWYGIGGTTYIIQYAQPGNDGTLNRWVVHSYTPAAGQAYRDPNLPIRYRVANDNATSNVEVQIGGRRFDMAGISTPERRLSGDYRVAQTVSSGGSTPTPLICFRREAEFPAGTGRANTVTVYAAGFDVFTDEDIILWIVVDPDLTGGTWETPSQKLDNETALEANTGVTSFTNPDAFTGPYGAQGGGGPQPFNLSKRENLRVQFPGTDPVCLAALVPGGQDATVSTTFRIVEGW